MRNFLTCFFAFCLMQAGQVVGQETFGQGRNTALVRSSVLPVEEAFAFSTFIEAPDTVVLLWEIQDGYYLYRDSISATYGQQHVTADIGELPAGESHTDEFFGETEIYRDRLIHRFPLSAV
jgi:thiol:disulfide interchange protein DsbD